MLIDAAFTQNKKHNFRYTRAGKTTTATTKKSQETSVSLGFKVRVIFFQVAQFHPRD